jgi:hypothetical protein
MKRVKLGKTVWLGTWSESLGKLLRSTFGSTFIFPMGAVSKPLEPLEKRPTDDHTRTGLNAATDLSFLRHTLDTYSEIAAFLKQDYFMRVSDVDAAFPLLPLHPDLWPFFLFRFFTNDDTQALSLFAHLCGDFGAAGMPGTFKVFFVDVVVNMARSAMILTLPMPIYVDDTGLIGPKEDEVNNEMETQNPNKWTPFDVTTSSRSQPKLTFFLITKRGTSRFSTDLSSGRRPMSESVEKCEVPLLIIEI